MLVKLLSNQIDAYQDVITETLEKTLPEYQQNMKTQLFEELLSDKAQCWIVHKDSGGFEGVGITRFKEDLSIGVKVLEVVSAYAFNGTTSSTFLKAFNEMRKFALKHDCNRLAAYTNNEEIIKYVRMFPILWETTYFQLEL